MQLVMFEESVSALHWPHVLLLADLYSQALLTMGDGKFFSSSSFSTCQEKTQGGSDDERKGENG